jgi:hypothetical protein
MKWLYFIIVLLLINFVSSELYSEENLYGKRKDQINSFIQYINGNGSYWITDGDDIVNNNSGEVTVRSRLNVNHTLGVYNDGVIGWSTPGYGISDTYLIGSDPEEYLGIFVGGTPNIWMGDTRPDPYSVYIDSSNGMDVAGNISASFNLRHGKNIINPNNSSWGYYNDGSCIVIGDLGMASEC